MTLIRFENQPPAFKSFVNQAAALAAKGKPQPEAVQALEAQAESDGLKSAREALVVQALREGRPETLKALAFVEPETEHFDLEIKRSPLPETSSNVDISAPLNSNPLGAKIRDRGEEVYGKAVGIFGSVSKLQRSLDQHLADKPALKASAEAFLKALPKADDREALAYLKVLLTERQPELGQAEQIGLLDKLAAMARTDYDHRVGANRELVVSALHDIALPSDISQHRIGTCAGTSAQIKLAQEKPGEYLKMLDLLGQNRPYTSLSGKEIAPNWSFTAEAGWQKSGRSPSSSLMQNAIMDYADGDRRVYQSSSKDKASRDGLYLGEAERIFEALFNLNYDQDQTEFFNQRDPEANARLMERLKQAGPSRSNAIYLSTRYDTPGSRDAHHAVLLVGIEGDRATLLNPWGREENVSLKTLSARLTGALLPGGELKPPPPPDPEAEKKYLEEFARRAKEMLEKP